MKFYDLYPIFSWDLFMDFYIAFYLLFKSFNYFFNLANLFDYYKSMIRKIIVDLDFSPNKVITNGKIIRSLSFVILLQNY